MKEDNIKSIGAEIRAEGPANRIKRDWLSEGLGEEGGDFDGDGQMGPENFLENAFDPCQQKKEQEKENIQTAKENIPSEFQTQRPSAIGGDSKIPVGNTGTNARKDRNLEKSGSGEE
jgi:hypothetical protein